MNSKKRKIQKGDLVMLRGSFFNERIHMYASNKSFIVEMKVPLLYLGKQKQQTSLFKQVNTTHIFLHNGTVCQWYGRKLNEYFKIVFRTKKHDKFRG